MGQSLTSIGLSHLYLILLYKKADSSEKCYPDFAICHKTLIFELDLP